MTAQALREEEMAKCAADAVYFVRNYVCLEDKDASQLVQPFDLWPQQEELLRSLCEHRLNIILKARQLGVTWLALALAAHTMLFRAGRTVVCFSRAEEEAKELVRRLGVIFGAMPALVAAHGSVPPGWAGPVWKATGMEVTLTFRSEPPSVCKAFPSSPAAARGFTADLVVLDEWAFQQYADEIWASIFPMVNRPSGGKVVGLSTIRRGTLFESLYCDPDNGFNKLFLPWTADPKRDAAWYARTRAALGEDRTAEEYPATPDEALTVRGGAMFPEVRAETHVRESIPEPARRYAAIDYGLDMFSAHWFAVGEDGRAAVYREYDAPNKTIGEAADILKTLTGDEVLDAVLAPPDLWSRSQETGRSRAQIFADHGVELVRASADFAAGCAAMKEWLRPDERGAPRLTFAPRAAPNLYRCLQKIQKDEKRPDVYAKDPHELTHDCDSLRYFCVWWVSAAETSAPRRRARWEPDLYEDYENADEAGKAYLIARYGDPF